MTSTFPKMAPERTTEEEEGRSSFRRVYEHVKREIPAVDAADLLCGPAGARTGLRRQGGGRWVGRCPLPGHEDRTPSFSVDPQKNVWHCFGCLRGGDVIDLWRLAHSMNSAWEAVVGLSLEFGVELPERSSGWKDARSRRDRMRDVHLSNLADRMTKRTFALHAMPIIRAIEDDEDRERTLAEWWDAWSRKLPFYAWASAMVARCEERRARWGVPDQGASDGE